MKMTRRTLIKSGLTLSAIFPSTLPAWRALAESGRQASSVAPVKDNILDLRGDWTFYRDDERRGINERWFEAVLPVGLGSRSIRLPGTTDERHLGISNDAPPSLDGLYRENKYVGAAWYQREIEIPDAWSSKSLELFLERVHWVTHVWIDGRALGSQDSLVSPHIYELGTTLKPGKHLLTICVDNTLLYDLGRFVSIYYEGTQTNWNGIIGRIEIIAREPLHVSSLSVFPNVARESARVKVQVRNTTGRSSSGSVHLLVRDPAGISAGSASIRFSLEHSEHKSVEADVPIGPEVHLWDEFTPNLYTVEATMDGSDTVHESVSFGMRHLTIEGKRFVLNGRPLLLRGTLECGIFPLTGYPPTDVESWRRIFQIEKSYGLNFIRFHSWTPPQAAFAAADIEGVFVQTEGPQANVETGEDPARDQFVEQELVRIVNAYGNHPSFALMAIGNEFGGSMDVITHWVDRLLTADSRHLYTSATSNSLKAPNRQWTEDATMRGVHGPGTEFDYDAQMRKEDRPFIGHEIAQWTYYPDLGEARKYTGVLKAKNFEIVRKDLEEKGMIDQAALFLEATGKHAVLLYKDEIECMLRTQDYAGFSLLDIHDYPGQGTALIGFLDPFWDSKGLVSPKTHKGYTGATVPLVRIPKRVFSSTENLSAKVDITHFGAHDLADVEPEWAITTEDGALIGRGVLPTTSLTTGRLSHLGEFSTSLAAIKSASKLRVYVGLKGSAIGNHWDIWVYPDRSSSPGFPESVAVADAWGRKTKSDLEMGKSVVLFQRHLRSKGALKGSFLPVFWSPIWFDHDPATMSVLVNPDHPLFAEFPTDIHSDWQWYNLLEGSQSMLLDGSPPGYRPLVQVIDNFARNHRLGAMFEARVGPGKLLVCSLNLGLESPEKQTIEQRAMLASISSYVGSSMFAPTQNLSAHFLDELLSTDTHEDLV